MNDIREELWGNYRGMRFELNRFNRLYYERLPEGFDYSKVGTLGPEYFKDCWTYYIWLYVRQLPEDIDKSQWLPQPTGGNGRWANDIWTWPEVFECLDWHCGLTWCSPKIPDPTLECGFAAVQVGCDYQHYWDEGHRYCWADLEYDAKRTIDSLLEMVPGMLTFGPNGKMVPCPSSED